MRSDYDKGTSYPWTISRKGEAYYPWNTLSGDKGPLFHKGESSESASAYRLAELWIEGKRSDERNKVESMNLASPPCDASPLREYTFLIPLVRDTSKAKHHDNTWSWLYSQLNYLFHGYIIGETVKGAWIDDTGEIVIELSKLIRVSLPPSRESELRGLLSRCKVYFDQQAIYLAMTSDSCELV